MCESDFADRTIEIRMVAEISVTSPGTAAAKAEGVAGQTFA